MAEWAVFRRDEKGGLVLVTTCETVEEADGRAQQLNRANVWSGWHYFSRHLSSGRWEVRQRYPSGREQVVAIAPSWRLATAQALALAAEHARECDRAALSPWLLFAVVEFKEEAND